MNYSIVILSILGTPRPVISLSLNKGHFPKCPNKNEDISYQNLYDGAKAVTREVYYRSSHQERSNNNLTLYLKQLLKEQLSQNSIKERNNKN